jgi:transposase
MYGEWTTTGCIFEAFLRSHVCPKLNAGDVVILDNAAIHKGKAVREMIEACGARLLYLPPYSPDFSPIELMWSKIKAFLRRKKTGNMGEFHDALSGALNELECEDFSGWFSHCGYSV